MPSALLVAAVRVLIGDLRQFVFAERSAARQSDRRSFADYRSFLPPELREIFLPAGKLWIPVPGPRLRYLLEQLQLATPVLLDRRIGPFADLIAAEDAADEIRTRILAALFPAELLKGASRRVPHPAAAIAAKLIRIGRDHGVDPMRVALWIEQERSAKSARDEILENYSAKVLTLPSREENESIAAEFLAEIERSGTPGKARSAEELAVLEAEIMAKIRTRRAKLKQEQQTASGSTDAAAPTDGAPAGKSAERNPLPAAQSGDRPGGRLARILRLAIRKGIEPDTIADAIEKDWTLESDPDEFVKTIVPDPWSAEPSDGGDQSPIGQLCAEFDAREQAASFFPEYDCGLADHLGRIADNAKLAKELDAVRRELERKDLEAKEAADREGERQERKQPVDEDGAEAPGPYEERKRRKISECKELKLEQFVEAMHAAKIMTEPSWQSEEPPCPVWYPDAYNDPNLKARRRWRKLMRDLRRNTGRRKS